MAEKNWMMYVHNNQTLAITSLVPFTVIKLESYSSSLGGVTSTLVTRYTDPRLTPLLDSELGLIELHGGSNPCYLREEV